MKKITLIIGLFLSVFVAQAQTTDEIIDKCINAMGGVDKWKKLESIRQSGIVVVQGMNIPFVSSQMRPNLSRQEGDFQGQKFVDAFDGIIAWHSSPFATMNKPTKKTDEEAAESLIEPFEDDMIDYKSKGHTVDLEANEIVDGIQCFKLKMKRQSGDEKIYFIDAKNYLPLLLRISSMAPAKTQVVESILSDYKAVDGLLIPHTIESKINGEAGMVIKADKVELNPKLDKTIFSFPKE